MTLWVAFAGGKEDVEKAFAAALEDCHNRGYNYLAIEDVSRMRAFVLAVAAAHPDGISGEITGMSIDTSDTDGVGPVHYSIELRTTAAEAQRRRAAGFTRSPFIARPLGEV